MIVHRLFQFVFLLEYWMFTSFGWEILFNIDEKDKLLCYSCKGNECEQVTNDDRNKVVCNKRTQLCWAGFIDQQPYRTCASRYCTPSDFSLDSNIRIETCCRSNLCNFVSLSRPFSHKSYKKYTSSRRNRTSTTTMPTMIMNTTHIFIDETMDKNVSTSIVKDSNNNEDSEENMYLQELNNGDQNHTGVNWTRFAYDEEYSNGVASIKSILLCLIPLLLVLLF